MFNKFFLIIQKNSWGLLPDKKSSVKAVFSLIIIILSIWWIKYAIDSGKPKEPNMDAVKAGLQRFKSEVSLPQKPQ